MNHRPLDRQVLASVLAASLLVGCPSNPVRTTQPRPGSASVAALASAYKPRIVPQLGQPTTLTGKVKLISDNGGGIISDNGGGVISNNGSSLISQTKYRLAQATREEALLAGAEVAIFDATGAQLVDDHGKPLAATTDAQGSYRLAAVLPAENVVLVVRMRRGGELAAMLANPAPGPREQGIGTATTLGAAYVLANYVKGDQQVYNKLPADQADQLAMALDAARGLLTRPPTYQAAELGQLADQLRAGAPAVDRKLEDIKALLIGQANLGNGRRATDVPLTDVRGLALDAQGGLLIGEHFFGRVRRVAPDGSVTTLVDGTAGQFKFNFRRISDLAYAPDGSLYVASDGASTVYKVAPDGTRTAIAGTGVRRRGAAGKPATETAVAVTCLAVAPDGTLYLGEDSPRADEEQPARLLRLGADGVLHDIPLGADAIDGSVLGIAVAQDGTVYVLYRQGHDDGRLYRIRPGQAAEALFTRVPLDEHARLACSPAGKLYVSNDLLGQVWQVDEAGQRTVVAGQGGPDPTRRLVQPGSLLAARDGTLYVADAGNARVWSLAPDGTWTVAAGRDPALRTSSLEEVAINAPSGAAVDAQGRLLVVESGTSTVRRLEGGSLVPVVGTSAVGSGGEGQPATAIQLATPTAVAFHDGTTYVMDADNSRIGKVGPDGRFVTAVGVVDGPRINRTAPGQRIPARQFSVTYALNLAVSPTGELYWCSYASGEVFRLGQDGLVELVVAGSKAPPPEDGGDAKAYGPNLPTGMAFDAAGDLYLADSGTQRIYKVTGLATDAPRIAPVAGVPMAEVLNRIAGGEPVEEGVPAKDATLFAPAALCFDAAGNLYLGESGTAGLAILGSAGGALPSSFLDTLPTLPPRIRKIAPDGTISTVAGPHGKYFPDPAGDDALALPGGLAVMPDGRLAVVDTGANLIRFLPAGSY